MNGKFDGLGTFYNTNAKPLYDMFNYENFDLLGDCWAKYEGSFRNGIFTG